MHGPASMQAIEHEHAAESSASFRRAPRPVRQTPTVPWPYLITCVIVLAALIMMVVKQRAELVKEQYKLVTLRTQRAKVLKERAELKLTIQRLSALDRVDGMVRDQLKMVRPENRTVLDLQAYTAADDATLASTTDKKEPTP
jgi:cell division protein FtsL